jgi:hypothetical protein
MPNLKRRLSRLEEATHRDYLRQLQAEGIDVEIPEEWQENSRALDIVLGESVVFESLTGGVCYAVLVRLAALLSGLILTEWELSTDYDAQIVPASFNDRDPLWSLGSQVYRQCEVLNSRIEKNLVLSRGQMAEGWLLATGIAPIPGEYSNFAVAPFRLTVWDQFGDEICAAGRLSVLRKVQRDSTGMRKGTGLYGLDATGKPRERSIEEDARRRYLDLDTQEKLAKQQRIQR